MSLDGIPPFCYYLCQLLSCYILLLYLTIFFILCKYYTLKFAYAVIYIRLRLLIFSFKKMQFTDF